MNDMLLLSSLQESSKTHTFPQHAFAFLSGR